MRTGVSGARRRGSGYTSTTRTHPSGREAVIGKDFKSLEWTVHLANKKAVWYGFDELVGDLMVPPPPDHKPPLAG